MFDIPGDIFDVFEQGKTLMALLGAYPQEPTTIRNVLTVAYGAFVSAIDQLADHVTPLHVTSAQTELE
jgi:hypothetical protein